MKMPTTTTGTRWLEGDCPCYVCHAPHTASRTAHVLLCPDCTEEHTENLLSILDKTYDRTIINDGATCETILNRLWFTWEISITPHAHGQFQFADKQRWRFHSRTDVNKDWTEHHKIF